MVDSRASSAGEVSWQALLGYLNFSEGRPEPRFQSQLSDAFRQCGDAATLAQTLRAQLADLR